MCLESWDGEHEWECFDVKINPEAPDDDDATIVYWCCALCGETTTTESWEGPPA